MKIEVLSDDEHTRWRNAEPALKQDEEKYPYERWAEARIALSKRLDTLAVLSTDGYSNGEFFIGDDWFEHGGLHIALLSWNALKPEYLSACKAFLGERHNDFLVTVVKSVTATDDHIFEIVILPNRSYMSFFDMDAIKSRNIVKTDPRFAAIRHLMTFGRRKGVKP